MRTEIARGLSVVFTGLAADIRYLNRGDREQPERTGEEEEDDWYDQQW